MFWQATLTLLYGSRPQPRGATVPSPQSWQGNSLLFFFSSLFLLLILSITKFSNLFGSQLTFIFCLTWLMQDQNCRI